MPAATYAQSVGLDPTRSFLYKSAIILERLIVTIKARVLIEMARLVFLGFYDDFRTFVEVVERAESASRTEVEYKAIWSFKSAVAEKSAKLIDRVGLLQAATYKGKNLGDYIVGVERLEHMKLFVEMTRVEGEGEKILERTKKDFLDAISKRKITKDQRAALLEKYRELFPDMSAINPTGQLPRS